MKLFDFFFPQEAQAAHLRRMADHQAMDLRRQAHDERARARRHAEIDARLESLEQEVGFLTLMLEAIIRKTDEKGLITRAELKALMERVDAEDGRVDGRIGPR